MSASGKYAILGSRTVRDKVSIILANKLMGSDLTTRYYPLQAGGAGQEGPVVQVHRPHQQDLPAAQVSLRARICVLCALAAGAVGLAVLAAACGGGSGGQASPSPAASGPVVLTVRGDEETRTFTMGQLKALPAYEGYAGIKSSTGVITPPSKYTGVPLTDLADLVGGISEANGVTIVAKDGYGMTFSYRQIAGDGFTTFDPATGEEEPADGDAARARRLRARGRADPRGRRAAQARHRAGHAGPGHGGPLGHQVARGASA